VAEPAFRARINDGSGSRILKRDGNRAVGLYPCAEAPAGKGASPEEVGGVLQDARGGPAGPLRHVQRNPAVGARCRLRE